MTVAPWRRVSVEWNLAGVTLGFSSILGAYPAFAFGVECDRLATGIEARSAQRNRVGRPYSLDDGHAEVIADQRRTAARAIVLGTLRFDAFGFVQGFVRVVTGYTVQLGDGQAESIAVILALNGIALPVGCSECIDFDIIEPDDELVGLVVIHCDHA